MPEIFDLFKTLKTSYSVYFVEHAETIFRVSLDDGDIDIAGKWLFFNVILWRPLISRKLPITAKRHLFYNELFDKPVIQRIYTNIYADILKYKRGDWIRVRYEFMEGINKFYNDIMFELGEYHRSINMVDISRTLAIPEIREATQFIISDTDNIQKTEAAYEAAAERVMITVAKPELRHNVFYPFIKLGALNSAQFPQVIMAGGPRTDVDDTMFTRPILGSYARGFRDIIEYAIDSRAAAKSEWYNKSTMGAAQYSNRKKQLLSMAVRHIYPGDCGTKVGVDFIISRQWSNMVIGKFICDDGGGITELTYDNIQNYWGKSVKIRSVLTCRYQDGFCRACGGRLVDFMPPGVVPGIAAEHEVMSPTAQLVLSSKHVSKTKATSYILPGFLRDQEIFDVDGNEIYFKPHVNLKNLALGVPFKSVERLADLQYVEAIILILQRVHIMALYPNACPQ